MPFSPRKDILSLSHNRADSSESSWARMHEFPIDTDKKLVAEIWIDMSAIIWLFGSDKGEDTKLFV